MHGCSYVDFNRIVSYGFSGAGDRLAQTISLYVESYGYMEVYDGMWISLVCSCVFCDSFFSYDIFWRSLQAGLNQIP